MPEPAATGDRGDWHLPVAAMLARLPRPPSRPSGTAFRHGTLEVKLYAPRGADDQRPHDRDEVYFVWRGSGHFRRGLERVAFGPGDMIFVAANESHRFEDFTDDFVTWVVFYGPVGGESA